MTRSILRFLVPASLAAVAGLTGCSMPSAILNGSAPAVTTQQVKVGGNIHGGQQPVWGSSVTLWAAGTGTGYGQGATAIQTVTSDSTGSFGFSTACTTGQLLYITATGGNSSDQDPTVNGTNAYFGVMAALPSPCSAATPNTFVAVNELTTVAAVWSLQQFMSITPGANTPWQIGSPSTNTTGMSNAFAGVTQLVNTTTGATGTSTVSNTISSVIYTTTIVPDSARMNTLADILASCINSDGSVANSQCATLVTDTTPSGQTAPGDTLQIAYYLATNPAGLTMPQHATTNGSPTYLCNTYVTASAPFQTTTPCTNVGDWTLTTQWKTVSGSTTIGTVAPGAIAIDSVGDVWTGPVSTSVNTNVVNQFMPNGQLAIAPVSSAPIAAYNVNYVVAGTGTAETYAGSASYALNYTRNFGIAVDTNNNAWYASYGSTSPGTLTNGTVSLTTGVVAQISKAGAATGYISGNVPGAITIDGSNNIFFSNQPAASKYSFSELTAASSYKTLNKGLGSVSSIYNGTAIDNSGYAWALYSGTTCSPSTIVRETDTTAAAGTTGGNVTDTVCTYFGATDAAGNLWSTAGGNLNYTNLSSGLTTPTVTTITGSTNAVATGTGGVGGLDNTAGVAIDGLGHVWVANRLTSTFATGITELVPTTSGTTTTVTALSEGGTAAGQFGFQGAGSSAIQGITLDGSGNVWFNTTGNSYLYHMVGAAAPVITPIASAVSSGSIGKRP